MRRDSANHGGPVRQHPRHGRTITPVDVCRIEGVPCRRAERLILEAPLFHFTPIELENAIDSAERLGLVSDERLRRRVLSDRSFGIEVEGHRTHSSRQQRQADEQRRTELTLRGNRVIAFTYDDVMGRPTWVSERVGEALAPRMGTVTT